MAIALEFIDLVVPIATIRKKYPGGWEGCLRDFGYLVGETVWYDQHLFRDGAMTKLDMEDLLERWEGLGFQLKDLDDGQQVWKDVCVVTASFGGPTLPCEWLIFDGEKRIAYLKGTEPGEVAGNPISRREQDT